MLGWVEGLLKRVESWSRSHPSSLAGSMVTKCCDNALVCLTAGLHDFILNRSWGLMSNQKIIQSLFAPRLTDSVHSYQNTLFIRSYLCTDHDHEQFPYIIANWSWSWLWVSLWSGIYLNLINSPRTRHWINSTTTLLLMEAVTSLTDFSIVEGDDSNRYVTRRYG